MDGDTQWKSAAHILSSCLCVILQFFLHRDWRSIFEMKVPMPIAVADIANRSQSSFLLTPALFLRMLPKSWLRRGLLCPYCAVLRHSQPSKIIR